MSQSIPSVTPPPPRQKPGPNFQNFSNPGKHTLIDEKSVKIVNHCI